MLRSSSCRSNIWHFFVKLSTYEAQCKNCGKRIKTCGNTSNMRTHLKVHNKKTESSAESEPPTKRTRQMKLNKQVLPVLLENEDESGPQKEEDTLSHLSTATTVTDVTNSNVSDQEVSLPSTSSDTFRNCPSVPVQLVQTSVKTNFEKITSFTEGGWKHSVITDAIVQFVSKDMLPYTTVEGIGFKNLMKTVSPLYKVPSRKTVKRRIEEKYEVLSNKFKLEFKEIQDITLTTDIWTETMTMKSFLGLTAHYLRKTSCVSVNLSVIELSESHTAAYITAKLKESLTYWEIKQEQILVTVTDNDVKMVKAINDLFGPNKHIGCFAHTLNLTVEHSLKNGQFEENISKVREIVKYFKNSTKLSDELRKAQEGNQPLKLKLDVKTRWNSTYYMLERFLILLPTVSTILLTKPSSPPMLTADDINKIKALMSILKIFEELTREASGENYLTISKVIPMLNCLKKHIENIECMEPSPLTKSEVKAFKEEIGKRFGQVQQNHFLSLSTILDPRFKNIHLTDAASLARTMRFLTKMIKELKEEELHTSDSSNGSGSSQEGGKFWDLHYSMTISKKKGKKQAESENSEITLYLSNSVSSLRENPLNYWEDHKGTFPYLYKLARKYLSPVATSVPSERLFSKAGSIVTKKRNRLEGKSLRELLFLSSLPEESWQ